MSKLKISVVSYLNSKVFIKGLIPFAEHDFEISLDIPSVCASKLINNTVDIGLIPVAVIPEVSNANIISNYCISTNNAVNSVFLFSNDELKSIHTIFLDPHSRTSNLLCKILAKEFWNLKVEFKSRVENIIELKDGEAIVLIGDRTFDKINNYKTSLDLSEHWKTFTGLPFVFAAWVANKDIDTSVIEKFNQFLVNGFNFLTEVIEENKLSYFDVDDYLRNKIEYNLTDEKRKAIELFLTKATNYN
jgi:chorismate dehydratase